MHPWTWPRFHKGRSEQPAMLRTGQPRCQTPSKTGCLVDKGQTFLCGPRKQPADKTSFLQGLSSQDIPLCPHIPPGPHQLHGSHMPPAAPDRRKAPTETLRRDELGVTPRGQHSVPAGSSAIHLTPEAPPPKDRQFQRHHSAEPCGAG